MIPVPLAEQIAGLEREARRLRDAHQWGREAEVQATIRSKRRELAREGRTIAPSS